MENNLEQAAEILNQGGIVIFPTDTAFGIGCRMDKEKAIQKLFTIRKRPATQAVPVLINSLEMAKKYLKPIPRKVIDKLIKPHWPGALTIVLPSLENKIPVLVRGGTDTLGVRMPDHPVPLTLINKLTVPLLAPSANFHGGKTPYYFEDLDKDLIKKVDFVLYGKCTLKKPSTVINCAQTPWKIIRLGAVQLKTDKIIVFIDTTSNEVIKVSLEINGAKKSLEQKLDKNKAQAILPLIDKMLKENKLGLKDLTGIQINPGPGSYTGIRVGLTIANTLAFLLKIPINNKPVGELVEPVYLK